MSGKFSKVEESTKTTNFNITDIERVFVQTGRGTDYVLFILSRAKTVELLGAKAEHWPEVSFSLVTPPRAALDMLKDMDFKGIVEVLDHQTTKITKVDL